MPSLEQSAAGKIPPAPKSECPACGGAALGGAPVYREFDRSNILNAAYVCASGHLWTLQWLEKYPGDAA